MTLVVNGLSIGDALTARVAADGTYALPDFSLPRSASAYRLTVAYSGDGSYAPSTSAAKDLTVFDSNTITAITRGQGRTARLGAPLTFHAHVAAVANYGAVPGGWVQFAVDGAPSSAMLPLDAQDNATWSASLTIGSHTVTASYVASEKGDADGFVTSRAALDQVVVRPKTRIVAGLAATPVPLRGTKVGFRVTGSVHPPVGFPDRVGCVGTVSLRLRSGTHSSTKAVRLKGKCRFSLSTSLHAGVHIPVAGAASLRTSFSGNKSVFPITNQLSVKDRAPATRAKDELPWIVGMGDSSMAGEGGRWAGNSDHGYPKVDALHASAYDDNLTDPIQGAPGVPQLGTYETINGCHRSRSEEVFIGGGVPGLDLACSGAGTTSVYVPNGVNTGFKPGIDSYASGPPYYPPAQANQNYLGQATDLYGFEYTHHVKTIMLGIGINNYGFGDIIAQCLTDYLTSPNITTTTISITFNPLAVHVVHVDHRTYCSHRVSVNAPFYGVNTVIRDQIKQAIFNTAQTMAAFGLTRNDYKIVVQTYPKVFADQGQMRYAQGGSFLPALFLLDKERQWTGGCGFWNDDVNWMMNTALPDINATVEAAASAAGALTVTTPSYGGFPTTTYSPNVKVLDVTNAFQGHLLCENSDLLVSHSWTDAGAVDTAEWVNQVYPLPAIIGSSSLAPYAAQESAHPNYWGQLAFRSCARMAYNKPLAYGPTMVCAPQGSGGSNTQTPAEPNMAPL